MARKADSPVAHEDVDAIDRLRSAFEQVGYGRENVQALVGVEAYAAGPSEVPVFLRRLGDTALDTVVRFFFLQEPVAGEALEHALGAGIATDIVALGVADMEPDGMRASVRIVPQTAGFVLASDGYSRGDQDASDHVSGFTTSASGCAALTVRRQNAVALDVGTGCGTQALLAARHSKRVVATDVNPRALSFAQFNARLNGVTNVEFRQGSLFEPVDGEQFDLIVCNAPYVISPEQRFAYRDSGTRGDAFSERLVVEAPERLRTNGLATLMVSWLRTPEEQGFDRPSQWVEGSGCDAWILGGRRVDPITYAAAWNDVRDTRGLGERMDAWIGNLRELGAEEVVEGAVILRKRSAPRNWVRRETVPPEGPEPISEHAERAFAGNDLLQELDDEGILDAALMLAPPHRFEHSFTMRAGAQTDVATRIRLLDGLLSSAEIDRPTAELLGRLDGRLTLRQAVGKVTGIADLDPSQVAALEQQAVQVAKEMLALGFLVAPPPAADERG